MFFGNAREYAASHPEQGPLSAAVRFLAKEAAGLEDGRHELADGVYAVIKHYQPGPAAEKRFETHRDHADVQYVIEGGESIRTAPAEGLPVVEDRIDTDDVRFHAEPDETRIRDYHLDPGEFLLLLPEDAHKPECIHGSASGRKAIVKIPMRLLR